MGGGWKVKVEGVTGWSIGENGDLESDSKAESESFISNSKLRSRLLFYQQPEKYARIMRAAIALNGSFFTAQRMMLQYVQNAYHPTHVRRD